MRVIAGTARSLPLKTPEGLDVRPTTDRIKETLFNMLQDEVPGAVFVDLFSGSGAIGIEALSRGAQKAYFVDNGSRALSCIQKNLLFTKMENRAIVIKQDAVSALGNIHEKEVDLIFMDPPYDSGLEKNVLEVLQRMMYVTENTLIVVEADKGTEFSYLQNLGFHLIKEKCYKTNKHVFIRRELVS
ncbi:MAG: 16S rRNA (guanine(966)-N(2))-methyltransferase RsmD [Acetatifactor sp.]|nr:16S rRNA (guanine(966)-N(2))-methyltransferase RsmD [Acetatifactor sp.]MDE7352878.1 16S rRNA (guanine(966)-N(2))-methyltransferase RsmD [Acetatifactor sp.]